MKKIFILICVCIFTVNADEVPSPQERLYKASCEAYLTGVQAAINEGANPNIPFKNDYSLRCASDSFGKNRADVITFLIKAGADINSQNSNGTSALMSAISHYMTWNTGIVQLLLDHGADPNLKNYEGKTALHMAAPDEDKIDIMKALIKARANLDIVDREGYTPLLLAIAHRKDEVVKVLLSGNPNLETLFKKEFPETVLDVVASRGNLELVQILINAGAKIQADNRSALFNIASEADPTNKNTTEVAKNLINAGATIDYIGKKYGHTYTPLMISVARPNSNISFSKLLIDSGADLNLQDNQGNTALIMASTSNNDEAVAQLLKEGAELNIQNEKGNTGLMFIGSVELLQLYVSYKPNLDLQNTDGNTVLMKRSGILSFTKILVEAGASLNIRNNEGYTALGLSYNYDSKKYLIEHGAIW